MCFTTIAMVTDHDAGVEGGEAVTHDEVLRVFATNVEHLTGILRDAIGQMPAYEPDATATCPCRRTLDGLELPFPLPDGRGARGWALASRWGLGDLARRSATAPGPTRPLAPLGRVRARCAGGPPHGRRAPPGTGRRLGAADGRDGP